MEIVNVITIAANRRIYRLKLVSLAQGQEPPGTVLIHKMNRVNSRYDSAMLTAL